MSPEHSFLESSQPATHEATFLGGGDQIDLHTSQLEPIEVIRARQAIAAAVATNSVELNVTPAAVEKIAPQKAIANITLHILAMRRDHGANTIDLFAEDRVVATELFRQSAEASPTDTPANFDLAA